MCFISSKVDLCEVLLSSASLVSGSLDVLLLLRNTVSPVQGETVWGFSVVCRLVEESRFCMKREGSLLPSCNCSRMRKEVTSSESKADCE